MGSAEGAIDGKWLGAAVGDMEKVGASEGCSVGPVEGVTEGNTDGTAVGDLVGEITGCFDVGIFVGSTDTEGTAVVGTTDGAAVGSRVITHW